MPIVKVRQYFTTQNLHLTLDNASNNLNQTAKGTTISENILKTNSILKYGIIPSIK